jgi:hypothetical protein
LEKNGIALLEFNTMASAIISYSYLAKVLATKYGAKIVAYLPTEVEGKRFNLQLKNPTSSTASSINIYRSFGTEDIVVPALDDTQAEKAEILYQQIKEKLSTKKDVEDIVVDNIYIGDLIYDIFLKEYRVPTIDLDSEIFAESLLSSIRDFIFWKDYFSERNVIAVNVSHCVYTLAIPLRIAVSRQIFAFQINATHFYRMSENQLFAYGDFKDLRRVFKTLPKDVREKGIEEAAQRIQRRFSGEVGVDMSYSKKSAFGRVKKKRVLRVSNKKKVLIATHCFFDSPHSFGNNLFTDYYEWMDFLGKITKVTDCDWYIKIHRDYVPGTKEIIESFVKKYPLFTLLPTDTSHHQIIHEGIDVVLTVHGTIGFEYAALGVHVINASLNNPHIGFAFNTHPKTIREYGEILRNLGKQSISIDKGEVYEYYYMKNIYNTENWLFGNYQQMVDHLGGYSAQFTPAVYDYWRGNCWSKERHKIILNSLEEFVDSGEFRLGKAHIGECQ